MPGKGRPFKKGEGGRPKGVLNKFTNLRKVFLDAFDKTGGTAGLVDWAKKNRAEFYKMIARMLPKEVDVSDNSEKNITVNLVSYKDVKTPEQKADK